jgi:hypothetical protein
MEALLESGASFYIDSIKIYNDIGRRFADTESAYSSSGGFYFTDICSAINGYSLNTIIEMGEELEIGSFLPVQKLVQKLRYYTSNKTICSYVTTWWSLVNSRYFNRLAYTANIQYSDIVTTENYPICTTADYTYSIRQYYKQLTRKKAIDAAYTAKSFSIVQAGEDFNNGKVPSTTELTAMLYTSLLTNYKGILLYSAIIWETGKTYEGLFTTPSDEITRNPTLTNIYSYLSSTNTNITQSKNNAITAFTTFINCPISDSKISYTNIGDLLLNQYQTGNSLSGFSGIDFNPLGNAAKVQLTSVGGFQVGVALYEIDQNTSTSGGTASIVKDTKTSGKIIATALPTAYYYAFYNLNETEAALNISAVFTSTNTNPSILVTTLNTTQYSGQVFAKNCTVPLIIPALGAVLLKVENSSATPPSSSQVTNITEKNVLTLDSYPNPFNPTTTIKFNLPETGHITLKIYDIVGREIATLIDEMRAAGIQQVLFNANNLPSGIYIYSLRTNGAVLTKKLMLIK